MSTDQGSGCWWTNQSLRRGDECSQQGPQNSIETSCFGISVLLGLRLLYLKNGLWFSWFLKLFLTTDGPRAQHHILLAGLWGQLQMGSDNVHGNESPSLCIALPDITDHCKESMKAPRLGKCPDPQAASKGKAACQPWWAGPESGP